MGVTSLIFIQLNINKNITMETLLERATTAGFTIAEPFEMSELVNQLNELAYEHEACASQFRGWLVGNNIPFTEEFGCIEDGIVYEDGIFILDEYPNFGFSFEDDNYGEYSGLQHWDL
jgi:hypothetical protein